jgi:ATP adenylyltransferase
MRQGDEKGEWDLLIDRIVDENASMPFEVFWERVSVDASKEQLYTIYNRLYNQAHGAVKHFVSQRPDDLELHDAKDGSSPFSYNLGMTTNALMLVPRRREGTALRDSEGSEIGFAAFNGTVLAGTMMVKKQEEWDLLRDNAALLNELLENIGIPCIDPESKDTRI